MVYEHHDIHLDDFMPWSTTLQQYTYILYPWGFAVLPLNLKTSQWLFQWLDNHIVSDKPI